MKKIILLGALLCSSAHAFSPEALRSMAHTIITKATPQDTAKWQQLKPLRFMLPRLGLLRSLYYKNKTPHPFYDEFTRVRSLLLHECGATPHTVTTDDGHQLAVLTCLRPGATRTLLFITGYFDYLTPPKEWVAPFVGLFPNCNIVMFDWRHVGESKTNDECSFGTTAHHDVVAMLRFCRTHEALQDTTLIAHSYCMGGAILLNTLVNHLPDSFLLPDGLNLSCVPARISDIQNSYHLSNPSWAFRTFFSIPLVQKHFFEKSVPAEVRALEPAQLLQQFDLPCNLEYCIEGDAMVPLEKSIPATYYGTLPKHIHLTLAQKSRHVRLQTMADQYVTAQKVFWEKVSS
jgi:hypothetical protein